MADDGAPLLQAADDAGAPASPRPPPSPPAPPVPTVDGDALDAPAARALARNLFRAGWCALPVLWLLNAWLFWPVVTKGAGGGGDPVVARYARRSAVGVAVAAAVVLPWAAAFTLGGPRLVGQALFDRLNVAGLDLDAYGLRF
jgi:presenilin enhancer 2